MADKSDHVPTLVLLIGPPAVGKMTVGQELERRTGLRLFYNHQVIDLLTGYFPFCSPAFNRLEPIYCTFTRSPGRAGAACRRNSVVYCRHGYCLSRRRRACLVIY